MYRVSWVVGGFTAFALHLNIVGLQISSDAPGSFYLGQTTVSSTSPSVWRSLAKMTSCSPIKPAAGHFGTHSRHVCPLIKGFQIGLRNCFFSRKEWLLPRDVILNHTHQLSSWPCFPEKKNQTCWACCNKCHWGDICHLIFWKLSRNLELPAEGLASPVAKESTGNVGHGHLLALLKLLRLPTAWLGPQKLT